MKAFTLTTVTSTQYADNPHLDILHCIEKSNNIR